MKDTEISQKLNADTGLGINLVYEKCFQQKIVCYIIKNNFQIYGHSHFLSVINFE